MSDKEVDSSEDIQAPIEFTVLQSETKSFPIPPDQDVFFTNAELVNIQPDSSNKVVTLSIDYEVVYLHSENGSEDEKENNTETIADKSNSNQFNEGDENNSNENKSIPNHTSLSDNFVPKKALDHIIISIPVSSTSSATSDTSSLNAGSSISTSNPNQSTTTSSQLNTADNSLSTNFLNHSYNYNSNTNSTSIQIQFCPDMNPVFHVSGPADVKLTGFTTPTNYNIINEEEDFESESESENEEIEENAQEENQNEVDDEKIEEVENLNEKEQINNEKENENPTN